ncbi:MAG: hypothetical protein M1812_001608 [Candelaria pacifica]|nr:MAG: hypothetical protein M1812_001608 [Candelaria pacifica]
MAPTSEFAVFSLVTNASIEDPTSDAGTVWNSTLDTVMAQDGYQRAYWGRQVESPDTLELVVDWESIDAHKAFTNKPIYGPFLKHLDTILGAPPNLIHVNFDPHPPARAISNNSSRVTEMCRFVFSAGLSDSQKSDFESSFVSFAKAAEKADAFRGMSSGWVVEEIEHSSLKGEKGKAFVAAIGWQSVDGHMEFRKTDEFKDTIKVLREKSISVDAHHVSFTEV